MFSKLSEQMTRSLENKGTIQSENRELYRYGFEQGFIMLLNLVTTLVIGLLFGKVLQLCLFMAAYIPLRSYAGGYHAKTPFRCYLLSIIILTAVTLCMKYLVLDNIVYYLMIVISGAVILLLSPVEDKNKPLDEKEIQVYKKRTVAILIFEMILFIVMNFLNLQMFSVSICYAMVMLGILLILGLIKNIISNKTK